MCTDGTPASPYLAKWNCTVQAVPPSETAVARTAAWAKATMHHWGLGSLADDVGLIVAEFSSSAWTHGSPPVEVTLLLQESVLTIEVSDAGPAWRCSPGPAPSVRAAAVWPPPSTSPSRSESTATPGAPEYGRGCTSSGYPPRLSPGPQPPERHHQRSPVSALPGHVRPYIAEDVQHHQAEHDPARQRQGRGE